MEENFQSSILEGEITGIRFGLATQREICTASISDCPISHSSQLANPFLGLPLEFGKCESCGTSEAGKCDGHFGYIELPIPIYHPSHLNELKRMLSLLCLKCLKLKSTKFQSKNAGIAERLFSCCQEASLISIREVKKADGACLLELKVPSRSRLKDGFWNFLERYGFRYGDGFTRTLLPFEVMEILKRMPPDTKNKLAGKGYFLQDGYVLHYLPVPPNCLSIPDISDGVNIMSSDLSISMLKKVLKQVEIIKSSRSGTPNFESHEVEVIDLQSAVDQYLQVRGTAKSARDVDARFGVNKQSSDSSTKAWLEKMRTLFIRKGSGFSSRSVITGDAYKPVNVIGIPFEIAQRITFEERVSIHNIKYLQELVDNKLCLTYRDGSSTYSLREGSKGHTFLRLGQVVHRRIMDGDIVFINRPPTTHKHSLQALSVYIHEDHTVKINPLICGPLSADFDGDCIHLFYPQSLAAKAEVMELFSVEKQLLSSHSGNLNLQLTTDALLSLKTMLNSYFLDKGAAQQLAMFVLFSLPQPAVLKAHHFGPCWTALQILQAALPAHFDCSGDRYLISKSDILKADLSWDVLQSVVNEVVTSIFFEKGPESVLQFFNLLQPLLMESLFSEGFSVDLEDFSISRAVIEGIQENFRAISPLLCNLRSTYNELVELQLENHIRHVRLPVASFILRSSALGRLIDSKSDSAITKLVQQIGFLGLQISDRGKLYSKTLVEEMASHFESKYPSDLVDYPSARHGLIQSCFFHGLDPYEEMVHSISTREVIVRSSRGLSEPGTLFKNLMAILRDVVICYDGTVRNVCSNSIIQFEYGVNTGSRSKALFPAGEPVGVLAATAMSNPAYKAVLDSTPSSNSSWELMKEILLSKVSFKNDLIDRRIILYLNYCGCGRKYCQEKAAYVVKNHLEKVRLKDVAQCFMIEYNGQQAVMESFENASGLVGHVHLKKMKLQELNVSMHVILQKCQETILSFRKKKKVSRFFKKTVVSVSECCSFQHSCADESLGEPCLMFLWQDANNIELETVSHILADLICPVLLETVIKGDHRISSANIIWVSPDTTPWIRNPYQSRQGELVLDVVLEKPVVKQSGDAWRIVIDSCLPVLHLIDTTRSIPYAVKQVQELLGISCAFDQAVQRLSTSVTMVAKGVLKEHLILLGNSMTCTGNLLGFNSGGYKALSRSLDVQVPFTEATLFTPRKCFERAAEKCHVDALSSIVASCSWGKGVAVGTGSRFDILWNTKDASLNEEGSTDVYTFLTMVRSAVNGEDTVTACLGVEVDDLMLEDEIDDWMLSPEHNSISDKPVFEDSAEFENCLDDQPAELNWGKVSYVNNGSKGAGSWDVGKNVGTDRENPWSSWGTNTAETENVLSTKAHAESDQSSGGHRVAAWRINAKENAEPPNSCSGRGTKKAETDAALMKKAQEESDWSSGWATSPASRANADDNVEPNSWSGWGTKKDETNDDFAKKAQEEPDRSSCWGTLPAWRANANDNSEPNSWSGWGTKKAETHDVLTKKAQEESACSSDWGTEATVEIFDVTASQGRKAKGDDKSGNSGASMLQSNAWSSWGMKQAETYDVTANKAPEESAKSSDCDTGAGLGRKVDNDDKLGNPGVSVLQSNAWSGWGREETEKQDVSSKAREGSARSSDWNASAAWEREAKGGNKFVHEMTTLKSNAWSDWGSQKAKSKDGISAEAKEDSSKSCGWNGASVWGTKKTDVDGFEPGKNDEQPLLDQGREPSGWDESITRHQPLSGWASSTAQDSSTKSRGWASSTGDWKSKKNRPAKSPGIVNDDSGVSGMYTTTRQRLDMFTSQEQDILSDVEPLMQSIRRIMHQSGYNDGDPLSAEDQSYILDNVLNYHPDKTVKMGSGVQHVTVSKHSSFQDSRCLYVVSTDGCRQDFSYRKCLENYIRGKYPDLAEEFISKYFARRSGGPRQ